MFHQNLSQQESRQNSSITVAKFGGTSVADYQAMLRCAHIIKNDNNNRLVVVSASAGVTNYLVRLSQENISDAEQTEIIEKIQAIQLNITQHLASDVELLLNSEIVSLLDQLSVHALKQSQQYSVKQGDAILAFGEQFSSRIFSQVLQSIGVNGHYFNVQQVMKTNSLYGKAVVDIEQLSLACGELLSPKLSKQVLVTHTLSGDGFIKFFTFAV